MEGNNKWKKQEDKYRDQIRRLENEIHNYKQHLTEERGKKEEFNELGGSQNQSNGVYMKGNEVQSFLNNDQNYQFNFYHPSQ